MTAKKRRQRKQEEETESDEDDGKDDEEIEASFKGVARCLRDAVRVEGTGVPSTKGVL